MAAASSDPYAIYANPTKGKGTRRWMELVGTLHQVGYGRLRLACSWEHAGPAPVWFGVIAPGNYFRQDHGAVLAQHPFPEQEAKAWAALNPNAAPMFSSRPCVSENYPWKGFGLDSLEIAALTWIEKYPQLASEGLGEDVAYMDWYSRMLSTTAPTGLISAYNYWEKPPGFMEVSYGPNGVEQFELPPPGLYSAGVKG